MQPIVSAIMANYNGALWLAAAMRSVLRQSQASLELIVADDNSTDNSCAIAAAFAADDPRVKLVRLSHQHGPAGARNAALHAATGEWLAIVDSDDLVHPRRFEILIDQAIARGADLIADNQVLFDGDMREPRRILLSREQAQECAWITPSLFVRSNLSTFGASSLGLLKPLMNRRALERLDLRYDETLVIGEDYDLIMRGLQGGLSYAFSPFVGYYYRKHSASISHRLSTDTLSAMRVNAETHAASALTQQEHSLHRARARVLIRHQHFLALVSALKSGRWGIAAKELVIHPASALLLVRALFDRLQRAHAAVSNKRAGKALRGRDWPALMAAQQDVAAQR